MKNFNKVIKMAVTAILLSVTCTFTVQSATVRAVQSGSWESSSTWQSGVFPAAGDSIVIPVGKIVEVRAQEDFSTSSLPMRINILGELTFQTGKKLILPHGSIIYLQINAYISGGNGGGSSNLIQVGTTVVWTAGQGTITGYLVLPSSPLPVELASFTGTPNADNTCVLLQWITVAEVNNHYFDTQRSFDGLEFESLGRVEGHGTTSNGAQYEFDDCALQESKYYYRLKQVDYDGKYKFSPVIRVVLKKSGRNSFKFYPNPASSELSLLLSDIDKNSALTIFIYNSRGLMVSRTEIVVSHGENIIDLRNLIQPLQKGIYNFIIHTGEESFSEKVVIN